MFKHKYNGIRRMKRIMKSLLEQGGYMTAESNWGCQKKYMRYRYNEWLEMEDSNSNLTASLYCAKGHYFILRIYRLVEAGGEAKKEEVYYTKLSSKLEICYESGKRGNHNEI